MANDSSNTQDKNPIIKKPSSPFNNDPHNNRGGKAANKTTFTNNGGKKMKSVNVKRFKAGSGGDR